MSLSIICAMTEEGVIGKDNSLPWHLPEDLKRFKKLTMGHPMIMGRKTFDSIGRPLPGRENLVVSRSAEFQPDGVKVFASPEEALESVGAESCFVIGGATLYEWALPRATHLNLTIVHKQIEGDTYFPDLDWKKRFRVVTEESHENEAFRYTFVDAVLAEPS